jgi:hypothetical protein
LDTLNNSGGALPFAEGEEYDSTSSGFNDVFSDDFVGLIVAPFEESIRLEGLDQISRRVLAEEDDGIYTPKCIENLSA